MRILYHFRVRGSGAEGVHIAGIVKALRAAGHIVSLVSPTNADPTQPGIPPKRHRFFTVLLHALADHAPQWFFEVMELLYNCSAYRKLRRATRAQPTDLLYERYAFFNLAGAYTARRTGIPLILEVNDLCGVERLRALTFKRLALWCERRLLKQATLIVAVSPYLARCAAERGASAQKIMVVPNGVERDWLNAAPAPAELDTLRKQIKANSGPVLGFVGGLVSWHKIESLLQAASKLRPELPQIQILLIGDGALRSTIEQLATKLKLTDNLTITGTVTHKQVRAYLELVDLAVIPHANEYRSPIKLFEYMGAGRAVLAPDTEPITSVINNGADGMLFATSDESDMTEKMHDLLNNPAERARLGANAREKIADQYLWEQHAARIIARLETINS